MLQTALEVLLQEAGYSAKRAELLATWIDQAAISGMSADDLYSAFMQWKRKTGMSESKVRRLTSVKGKAAQDHVDAIKQEVFALAEEARKYQQLFEFAAQPETVARVGPTQVGKS